MICIFFSFIGQTCMLFRLSQNNSLRFCFVLGYYETDCRLKKKKIWDISNNALNADWFNFYIS